MNKETWKNKETWNTLIALLKTKKYGKEYDIRSTLTEFLEHHSQFKSKRRNLAALLSWYVRTKRKIIRRPYKKLDPHTHGKLIIKTKRKLCSLGYKAVIMGNTGHRIPDIVAFKNGKVHQIEVQLGFKGSFFDSTLKKEYKKTIRDPQYNGIIVISNEDDIKKIR